MTNKIPAQIERNMDSGLKITWRGGELSELSSEALRNACPCAGCRESRGDRSHSEPLTAGKSKMQSSLTIVENTREESLSLERIEAVGNYAIRLVWKDGHQDGIYTYDLLSEISK